MHHEPVSYQFLGQYSRVARNGKHYWLQFLKCPVCGREVRPLANATRGRAMKCAGAPPSRRR